MDVARQKKMLSLALDPALLERLDVWIAAQELRPSKTAVLEAAIRSWLDAREEKVKKR